MQVMDLSKFVEEIDRGVVRNPVVLEYLHADVLEKYELLRPFFLNRCPIVGVYGAIKVGKSTLLNSLLGRDGLLKARQAEATSAMMLIQSTTRRDEEESASIYFRRHISFSLMLSRGVFNSTEADELIKVSEAILSTSAGKKTIITVIEVRDGVALPRRRGLAAALLTDVMKALKKERLKIAEYRRKIKAGKRYELPESWIIELVIPRRENEHLKLPEELERLHEYSALQSKPVSRFVRSITLRIAGSPSRVFPYAINFVDLPGRGSLYSNHNSLAGIVERFGIDAAWYVREALERDDSTSEVLQALRREEKAGRPRHLVITKLDDSVESLFRDDEDLQARKQELLGDIRKLRKVWFDRIMLHWLKSRGLDLPEVRACTHYTAAKHEEAEVIANADNSFLFSNPFRFGLKRLGLVTMLELAASEGIARRRRAEMLCICLSDIEEKMREINLDVADDSELKKKIETLKKFSEKVAKTLTPLSFAGLNKAIEAECSRIRYMDADGVKFYVNSGMRTFLDKQAEEMRELVFKRKQEYLDILDSTDPDRELRRRIVSFSPDIAKPSINRKNVMEEAPGFLTGVEDFFRGIFGKGSRQLPIFRTAASAELRKAGGRLQDECNETLTRFQRNSEHVCNAIEEQYEKLARRLEQLKGDQAARKREIAELKEAESTLKQTIARIRSEVEADAAASRKMTRNLIKGVGERPVLCLSLENMANGMLTEVQVRPKAASGKVFVLPVAKIFAEADLRFGQGPFRISRLAIKCGDVELCARTSWLYPIFVSLVPAKWAQDGKIDIRVLPPRARQTLFIDLERFVVGSLVNNDEELLLQRAL